MSAISQSGGADPATDLWRRTLSQIPGVYGRLVYLSSLRDGNTGRYQHHGLASRFTEDQADQVLRSSHEQVFQQWLSMGLDEQKSDLDEYLASLMDDKRLVVETWLRLSLEERVVPSSAKGAEADLFHSDFRELLEVLRLEYGAAVPDRGA